MGYNVHVLVGIISDPPNFPVEPARLCTKYTRRLNIAYVLPLPSIASLTTRSKSVCILVNE